MKCPACGDLGANEVNISVNISECNPGEEKEYSGWTDFAPTETSAQIGVWCDECGQQTIDPEWQREIFRYLASQGIK